MSAADLLCADSFTVCSDGLAAFLRRFSAKYVARATGAAVVTVEGWQAGRWPQGRHLVALTERFGKPFLEAAFGPVVEADAPLSQKLARVEDEIRSIREEIDHAARQPDAARAGGKPARGAGAVAGADRAARRGTSAARRVTGALALAIALAAPVQEVFDALSGRDDDDWARFFRSRTAAARVVRVASGRGGETWRIAA